MLRETRIVRVSGFDRGNQRMSTTPPSFDLASAGLTPQALVDNVDANLNKILPIGLLLLSVGVAFRIMRKIRTLGRV